MKKKMIALLAGLMLTLGASGSAFAYFGDITNNNFDLIRVVYDSTGTVEVATDLGNNLTASGTSSLASAFSLSQFGSGKTMADLNVSYFAIDKTTNTLWTTSTTPLTSANINKSNALSAIIGVQSISNYYMNSNNATVVGDQNNALSYYSIFDKGGALIGSADNALNPMTNEANLAALATGSFVDLQLYKFTGLGRTQTLAIASDLVLRTNANGTTTVNPAAATPIPPAFFLMGSGLLGMVGLRRKQRG